MAITFRYKTIQRPDGEKIYGPWVPALLHGPKESIGVIFLLDSGADYTVIPIEIAELLGLDLSKPTEKTKGVGGEIETKPSNVSINIRNAHENYMFTIPLHVILEKNTPVPPLLGRAEFFDKFIITFNQRDGKVIFKRKQRRALYEIT